MIKIRRLLIQLILMLLASCIVTIHIAQADQLYPTDINVSRDKVDNTGEENHPNSNKILGGIESKSGDWPWMTALLSSDEPDTYQAQFCGGVLIGKSWILTAAHCAYGQSPNEIEVAVGAYDLSSPAVNRIQVKSIHIHSQYNATSMQNDIALLEMTQPSSQPTVPLFAGQSREGVPASMIGETATAIGWGVADSSSSFYYPEKLRQVDLPIISNKYCDDIYGSPYLLPSQICAGYYEGKDTCGGDSGGAIVSKVDGTWVHVGLVSYGTPCDRYNGWYGVYTRTSSYIDFIKQYVPDVSIHPSQSKGMSWLILLLGEKNEPPVNITFPDPIEEDNIYSGFTVGG